MSSPWKVKPSQKRLAPPAPAAARRARAAGRGDDADVEALHRHPVARRGHDVPGGLPQVHVPREGGERALALVDGGPVVDERPDRQPLRELMGAAHVVAVEVGDDQVVDRVGTGIRGGRGDAVGIAPVEARPPGVEEHRLAGRGDEERRLAPLHVDDVDLQRVVRPVLGRRGDGRETETEHEDREGAGKSHGVAPATEIRVLDIDADNVACGPRSAPNRFRGPSRRDRSGALVHAERPGRPTATSGGTSAPRRTGRADSSRLSPISRAAGRARDVWQNGTQAVQRR